MPQPVSNCTICHGGPTPFADGTRYSAGYEVVRALFAKGVRRVWVLRIVGANATVGYGYCKFTKIA